MGDVATVAVGPGPRRGVLEKDGGEVVGGVVLMASGENPLEVTRRIKAKIHELPAGLPPGVSIVPFYDRTPLIEGAIGTVTRDGRRGDAHGHGLRAASSCCTSGRRSSSRSPCRWRSSARSRSWRRCGGSGVVDIQANIMSLAGHRDLDRRAGRLVGRDGRERDAPAPRALRRRAGRGATSRAVVLPACLAVGRPIFFSVVDHAPVVPAGLRPRRDRGEDVPPAGLHQDVRPADRRRSWRSRWSRRSARSSSGAGSAASRTARSSGA